MAYQVKHLSSGSTVRVCLRIAYYMTPTKAIIAKPFENYVHTDICLADYVQHRKLQRPIGAYFPYLMQSVLLVYSPLILN